MFASSLMHTVHVRALNSISLQACNPTQSYQLQAKKRMRLSSPVKNVQLCVCVRACVRACMCVCVCLPATLSLSKAKYFIENIFYFIFLNKMSPKNCTTSSSWFCRRMNLKKRLLASLIETSNLVANIMIFIITLTCV